MNLADYMEQLFGAYTPGSGDGIASLDIPWIAAFILFCIMLYSFLRLVGVFLNRG